ncbi:hypothetical protein FE810_12070 [Thalassotalea litorea]|uniref:DUF4198 domain-containing protein n=1 Tax=Thalassotalea litorea TaxID=2020715 RepID=A0A5R9IM47_9GAMM|nr:hypothetical protein [Thalassotalea litorea]TLU64331.1 hypothetical protein FE810_12070 [Thalassotalea litorea]
MFTLTLKKKLWQNFSLIGLAMTLMCVQQTALAKTDEIVSLSAQEQIGFTEKPVVHLEVAVKKTRDLHVAFQNSDDWTTVKRSMKRIKKSGKYHFTLDTEDLAPGNYRVSAYLTPRAKNWNDRLAPPTNVNVQVLDQKVFKKPAAAPLGFAKRDVVKKVEWPTSVDGDQDLDLEVRYDITQERQLWIKLLDSENWEEHGSLKYLVKKPGKFNLPMNNVQSSFPAGKYAWVIYLTEVDGEEPIGRKFGKHFEIQAAK